MILNSLSLRQFRNYQETTIQFDPSLTILTGANASGKTNLLEALVYLSMTRSFRISDDQVLIRNEEPFASIACDVTVHNRNRRLEAIIHNKGKTLMVNAKPMQKASSFIGILNVILFSPDDLTIYKDSPKTRRKLVDSEILKFSTKYMNALSKYNALLKERNALLKSKKVDRSLLDVLQEQMLQEEIQIIKSRRAFEKGINTYMTYFYRALSNESDSASIHYDCMSNASNKDLYGDLTRQYKETVEKDIEYRFTSIGIHREDVTFLLNGQNVCLKASQGQKRLVMLAFKMSLLKLAEIVSKEKPILLLDDVLSELDPQRQRNLLKLCGNEYQCIITTTHLEQSLYNYNFELYEIKDGRIMHQRR